MKPLEFYATEEQGRELSALAYWIADSNYIRERYGSDDPEHEKARKTVGLIFDSLDSLRVPFWVQNAVICWAEDWRRYKTEYMQKALEKRRIYIGG